SLELQEPGGARPSGLAMAESGRNTAALDASSRRTASPAAARGRAPASAARAGSRSSALGHRLRRVTLSRPTFCHGCSDFIWGLVGYQCEVCNFMCHEKCVKVLQSVCSCLAPSAVQVPVAHCFVPAGHRRRFCCVCRRQTEGDACAALRRQVCELHVHADCAIFSCADCRRTHQDATALEDTFPHHWREGNLCAAARCEVCRRCCGSADVPTGMRCEWCGITTHGACYTSLPAECALGRLRRMLLHPACVCLSSRNFSKMHVYRITESCSPDWATGSGSRGGPGPRDWSQLAPSPVTGKQFLRVFDGDDAVKRGSFRLVSVLRATKNEEVVEAALRAFYLPDQAQDYELHQIGGSQRLHSDEVLDRSGWPKDGGEAWLLRARPRDADVIKVYAGWARAAEAFVPVPVSKASTSASVLAEVLRQLQEQDKDASGCSLVEVLMSSRQVLKHTLSPQDQILDRLRDIRKVSLRQMNQTRFYAVEKAAPRVCVHLLVGGLPPLLDRERYAQLLQEHLAVKSHLVTVSQVYSSQAGVSALQISCFSEAERIYMLAKDTMVHNKTLTSLVVPEIQVQHLAVDACPLLVFVNPKSGGLKGRELLHSFRKLLNPHQVLDLTNGGPLAGGGRLHMFRQVPRFRVLVCGGDGTVGWVLGLLEAVRHKLVCREPPVAIVPLGTGNDLARILRWGSGYGGEDPHHVLVSVDEAEEVLMDRWTILLDAQDVSEDGRNKEFLEPPKVVQMSNYFGLGIDAELSLDFHLAREDEPDKFTSRFHNKGVYVKVGLQKMSQSRSLHKELLLQVDQRDVPLPSIEGLIFLNIPSWGSGADLWGSEVDGHFRKPRMDDGLLEVVGVTGVVHMGQGQVQSGMRSGIRIAQGNYVRLTLSKAVPVQVDGEPWVQPPGHVIISAAGPKVRMLRKSKQKKKSSAGVKDGRSESPSSRDGGR
uniref:Diacylglycerol kinase n=1 Tax=Tetraodon nigroviridis TaxID=99883 RepID=H3CAH6_TETNG